MREEHADVKISMAYRNKSQRAEQKNQDFGLSFAQFKKIYLIDRCYYTGIKLTRNGTQEHTDHTFERLDSSLGYVPGNVVACCHAANQVKGQWERPGAFIDIDMVQRIVEKLK